MLRFDSSLARLYISQGQNRKMEDFMPWPIEEEKVADINDVARFLSGVAAAGKKKD